MHTWEMHVWSFVSLCIHFSLDLIFLCTQTRVFLSVSIKCSITFSHYIPTLPQNS